VFAALAHVQGHLHRRAIVFELVLLDHELLHEVWHGEGTEVLTLQLHEECMQPLPGTVPQVSKTPDVNPRLGDLPVGFPA
jgi:hypothetical protein